MIQDDDEETPYELARSQETQAGRALWDALNENNPTTNQLKERRRLTRRYLLAVSELIEEFT